METDDLHLSQGQSTLLRLSCPGTSLSDERLYEPNISPTGPLFPFMDPVNRLWRRSVYLPAFPNTPFSNSKTNWLLHGVLRRQCSFLLLSMKVLQSESDMMSEVIRIRKLTHIFYRNMTLCTRILLEVSYETGPASVDGWNLTNPLQHVFSNNLIYKCLLTPLLLKRTSCCDTATLNLLEKLLTHKSKARFDALSPYPL